MRRRLLALLPLLLVSCGNMTPPTGAGVPAANVQPTRMPTSPTDEGVLPTADEALRRDAQSYATAIGVGEEEAIQRMQLQEPIGVLNARLERDEAATFAGLWIEHTPR